MQAYPYCPTILRFCQNYVETHGASYPIATPIERYLKLLRENMDLYGVAFIGYCLMSNHVHMIAILTKPEGFAEALKQIHGRYACYWNVAHPSSGHVGQGRYYSCPLDQTHLWEALRYTELNPVRARLVSELFANELTQAGRLGTRSLFRS